MEYTLAIDTSTPISCVAIYHSQKGLIGEIRLSSEKKHSEKLLQCIDFLMTNADMKIDDIDFFTISIGPGSFTGLRVGLSTVKGLCFATGKPVVAVSTLEVFANAIIPQTRLICPMIDARKKEVYAAIFKYEEENIIKILPEKVLSVHRLFEYINDQECLFLGNGAILYQKIIVELLGKKAYFVYEPLNHPLASVIGFCGIKKAEKGEFSDPDKMSPFYLRKSEAELNKEKILS